MKPELLSKVLSELDVGCVVRVNYREGNNKKTDSFFYKRQIQGDYGSLVRLETIPFEGDWALPKEKRLGGKGKILSRGDILYIEREEPQIDPYGD